MADFAALESNTLLPTSDRACYEIAEHLRDELNSEYGRISSSLPNPVQGDRPVVQTILDYNGWSNNFGDFPLLAVYRNGSSGQYLEQCEGVVAYYLPSLASVEEAPGILRWVETRIARRLAGYSDFFMGNPDRRHANVLRVTRSDYGLGVLPGSETVAFPFFRIFFDFEEIGV